MAKDAIRQQAERNVAALKPEDLTDKEAWQAYQDAIDAEEKRLLQEAVKPFEERRKAREAKREAERKANREAFEQEEAERKAAFWKREKSRQERLFLGAGGTKAEFETAWPDIKADLIRERAAALDRKGGVIGRL
jgi:hypothetical protein